MRWLVTIFIIDLLMWITAIEGDDEQERLQAIPKSSRTKKNQIRRRSKRSLSDFENTINCLQPWANVLLTYGDYGCYCGYRGHGRPLDDTDKCCYYHDNCYAEADTKASYFSEWSMGSYLTSYSFDCINGTEIICREKDNTAYGQALCECDRKASECFLANRKTYSKKLYDIDAESYCKDDPDFHGIQLETHTLMKLYTCQLQGDQDKCCVDQGYNSVYQICCNGKIKTLPSNLMQYFGCCGNHFYDSRIQMCCYGAVHPNAAQFKCCGTSGGKVDTTIAVCVNGKSVEIKKYTNNSHEID